MNDHAQPVSDFDQRLIDGLYVEAILLADEARAFLDYHGESCRLTLNQLERVDFACESLKVTTRIMHVLAWLLTQRAVFAGELPESSRLEERYQLGEAATTDPLIRAIFTPEMEGLILASEDLYERIARVEQQLVERAGHGETPPPGPARDLMQRLQRSL